MNINAKSLWGAQKTSLPQRVWEIRVDSVLKLDRATKRELNDDNTTEVPAEGHLLTRSPHIH